MRRGEQGERGQTGDHGQDGRDGRDADFYEDPAINTAIAEALGEKKMRSTDRRLWFLLAFLALGMGLMFWTLEQDQDRNDERDAAFRSAVVKVCEKTNTDNRKVNAVLDQLAVSAASRADLTPAEAQERAATYRSLRLSITECPPPT